MNHFSVNSSVWNITIVRSNFQKWLFSINICTMLVGYDVSVFNMYISSVNFLWINFSCDYKINVRNVALPRKFSYQIFTAYLNLQVQLLTMSKRSALILKLAQTVHKPDWKILENQNHIDTDPPNNLNRESSGNSNPVLEKGKF